MSQEEIRQNLFDLRLEQAKIQSVLTTLETDREQSNERLEERLHEIDKEIKNLRHALGRQKIEEGEKENEKHKGR